MRKPSFALFRELNAQFNDICRREGLRYQLIPYFISSHPGCTEADMERLSAITRSLDFRLEQVQDLTPTPMTLSSVMFYTESDPYTGRPLYVAKSQDEKRRQKSYFFRNADGTLRSDQLVPRRGKHGQSHRAALPLRNRTGKTSTPQARGAIRRRPSAGPSGSTTRPGTTATAGGPDTAARTGSPQPQGKSRKAATGSPPPATAQQPFPADCSGPETQPSASPRRNPSEGTVPPATGLRPPETRKRVRIQTGE